jgi:hypothetical protein
LSGKDPLLAMRRQVWFILCSFRRRQSRTGMRPAAWIGKGRLPAALALHFASEAQ